METAVQTPFGAELVLPDGYNEVSINWGAGTGVGQLLVSLKGANFVGLTGLNNGAARIDAVDWGIVNGEVSGASGHLDMDDFSSNR